ncbi:2-carboxy-1,4-naphthoquinone phytyltransferase [Cyanobacterium stanieri LEGE 03274]|uniref:2-carboxy-1,4-naphthoquinone phytyltransferase n=1 Tax=Cyanobacterium stanieri LEGE 03274 TaxID=1828756 RepID=A0ABR9V6K7_9CHRO|nr:2-carboxy-1,4-naphthoquinone phytyltransferase [Cyanobacterium stanieri]MBE9223538.1 2-carboxy-1,4-naphthoquinone phytyltransferase [Cyanobacterium stanieri LEGE 03274]
MTITNPITPPKADTKQKLWLAAIKPPMYTVAVIPISFGTALAYFSTGTVNFSIYITFLLSAIAIIAWLNLTNDVFDADTGIDVNKHHSVVNLTGNKALVFWIANIILILGLGGIFLINWWQQDWTVLWLILVSCFLGYTYQGPPFRLGYQGLGEIICFFTFGPMAIASAYYSQNQSFSFNSIIASTIIGISTSIILFCSHFHQVQDDTNAGKKSPIVRLGTKTGANVLIISVFLVYILSTIFVLTGQLPQQCLLVWFSFPVAYQLINHVNKYHAQPEKIKNSKFIAVNFHFISGLLLCLGLCFV